MGRRHPGGSLPLYLKSHSYGEYVFDWAWASAYEQHRVPYYPKAVIAVPFTPVPGSRLLARDAATRALLVQAVCQWCEQEDVSSVHVLFASDDDVLTSAQQDLMLRHTVQFHWKNERPTLPVAQGVAATDGETPRYQDFDQFLASLSQDKRKKIRQERRRVADAGVTFRWSRGADISAADWDFSTAATSAPTWSTATRPTSRATSSPAWQRTCPRPGCCLWGRGTGGLLLAV